MDLNSLFDKRIYDIFVINDYLKYGQKSFLLPSIFQFYYFSNLVNPNEFWGVGALSENNLFNFVDVIKLIEIISNQYFQLEDISQLLTIYEEFLRDLERNAENLYSKFSIDQIKDFCVLFDVKVESFISLLVHLKDLFNLFVQDKELLTNYVLSVFGARFEFFGLAQSIHRFDKKAMVIEMLFPVINNPDYFFLITDKSLRYQFVNDLYSYFNGAKADLTTLFQILFSIPSELIEFVQLFIDIVSNNKQSIIAFNKRYKAEIPIEYDPINTLEDVQKFLDKYFSLESENLKNSIDVIDKTFELPHSTNMFIFVLNFVQLLIEYELIVPLINLASDNSGATKLRESIVLLNFFKIINGFNDYRNPTTSILKSAVRVNNYIDIQLKTFLKMVEKNGDIRLISDSLEKTVIKFIKLLIKIQSDIDKSASQLIGKIKYKNLTDSPFGNKFVYSLLLSLDSVVQSNLKNSSIFLNIVTKPIKLSEILYLIKIAMISAGEEKFIKYANLIDDYGFDD